MSVTSHLSKRLMDLLEENRIVVWFDGEGAFRNIVAGFRAPACKVVTASESILRARREAEMTYRKMNESDNHAEARTNLLIYVPWGRGPAQRRFHSSTPAGRTRNRPGAALGRTRCLGRLDT